MNTRTTWRKLIEHEMTTQGETMADVVGMRASEYASPRAAPGDEDYTPPIEWSGDAWLDIEFDGGYGSAEGCRFTVWTAKRVYFPTEYDGSDDCSSAPRDPCDEAMRHV